MPTFPLPLKHAQLDQHNARLLADIALDTATDDRLTDRPILSMLGDEKQLRGIPALAHGVQGAIAGTRP